MKKYYQMTKEEIMELYNSSEKGLNDELVKKNLKIYGKNEIKENVKKSKAIIFLEQFKDTLVLILIACAIVSMIIGEIQSTIVIFFVISVNACLGTYQYIKAEKSLNSLKKLSSPNVHVVRNNIIQEIKSEEVVCGDIVIVNSGDLISADGRIIEENNLEINESSLTGESSIVTKEQSLLIGDSLVISEQKNMVFSGTFCTKGNCKYIVTSVGMKSELGKIASLINRSKTKKTPLQENLDNFSKYLTILIIIISIVVFLLGVYKNVDILDSMMFAVALAVAAIPEALSTIVVIVLAAGTEKMAKENAIIKELKAVEGLGCVSVICTDKTGTLTTNKMEVVDYKNIIEISEFKKNILFSTSYLKLGLENKNPTEIALVNFSGNEINNNVQLIKENSFNSNKKMMSNIVQVDNKKVLYAKGAYEEVIKKCTYYGNKLNKINDLLKDNIKQIVEKYASEGKRVIVFAYTEEKKDINNESNLIFSGIVAIKDPLRVQSKSAVRKCINAGIKPIMLTGDHKLTAKAIASEVGIYNEGDLIITGTELELMDDNTLKDNIDKITVYSRLTPEHKIRIVKSFQDSGKVVAMTGDGVNDAPALKEADISIAMGTMGTEVAKEASSIILVDDNFDTIVKSVSNGRKIYANIQNAIRFLLSGNFAGILIVLFSMVFNLPLPFAAVHLLFINLINDSIPAIAIGIQPHKDDFLNNQPRRKKEHILTKKLGLKIILEGILISLCCIGSYQYGLNYSVGVARTMTFATLCIARLFHSFNCCTKKSIFSSKFNNITLFLSMVIGLVLINLVLLYAPLHNVFIISNLTAQQIIIIYCYAILPFIIIQIFKLVK